jgi:hypothetical protein
MYRGFSSYSVPSLSKVAMRSAGGTNVGLFGVVTFVTKSMMALLAAPSFHDSSCVGLVATPCICRANYRLSYDSVIPAQVEDVLGYGYGFRSLCEVQIIRR